LNSEYFERVLSKYKTFNNFEETNKTFEENKAELDIFKEKLKRDAKRDWYDFSNKFAAFMPYLFVSDFEAGVRESDVNKALKHFFNAEQVRYFFNDKLKKEFLVAVNYKIALCYKEIERFDLVEKYSQKVLELMANEEQEQNSYLNMKNIEIVESTKSVVGNFS